MCSILDSKFITLFPLIIALIAMLSGALRNHTTRSAVVIVCSILYYGVSNIISNIQDSHNIVIYSIQSTARSMPIGLYIDYIGQRFLLILGICWPLAALYTIGYFKDDRARYYQFWISCSIFASTIIALSSNLMTMFIGYELLTFVSAPMLITDKDALAKYLKTLLTASTCVLFPCIVFMTVHSMDDFTSAAMPELSAPIVAVLLLMTIFGTAKAAIVPIHSWLPSAMTAPYPVSAILHAVAVVKAGAFVILKIVVYSFKISYLRDIFGHNSLFLLVPAVTILYSSVRAIQQTNVKQILAYSTIGQISIALLSLFTFSTLGVDHSLNQLLWHSVTKIIMFFTAGAFYFLYKTNELRDWAGIGHRNPYLAIVFTIAAISLAGLPLTIGFINKHDIMELGSTHSSILSWIIAWSPLLSITYIFKIIFVIWDTHSIKVLPETSLPFSIKFSLFMSAILLLWRNFALIWELIYN